MGEKSRDFFLDWENKLGDLIATSNLNGGATV